MTATLYDKGECPFCWKIRLALTAKEVPFVEHRVDTDDKPPELLALNPSGKVPVLLIDDLVLFESTLVLHFLEDYRPEPSLLPEDIRLRHKARWLNHYADTQIGPRIRDAIFEKRGKPEAQWDRQKIEQSQQGWLLCLSELNEELGDQQFFTGQYSIAECALLPRFGLAAAYCLNGIEQYPNLERWFQANADTQSYRSTAPDISKVPEL